MAVVVNFLALGVKRREPWFLAVLPACVEIPLVRMKRAKVKLMVTSDTMKNLGAPGIKSVFWRPDTKIITFCCLLPNYSKS